MIKSLKKQGLLFTISIILGLIYAVGTVLSAKILQIVIDRALEGNMDEFKKILLLAIGFLLIFALITYAYGLINNLLTNKVIKDYREIVYSGIMERDYEKFNSLNSADYISSLTNDMKLVEENYIEPLLTSIQYLFIFIATLIMLFSLNVIVALSLITSVILMFIMPSILGRKLKEKQEQVSKKLGELTTTSKDIFAGFEVVKTFNVFNHFNSIFFKKNKNITEAKMIADNLLVLNETVSSTLGTLSQFVVVFVSTYLIIRGDITAGTTMALIQLSGSFIMPIITILTNFPKIKGIESVLNKLDLLAEVNSNSELLSIIPNIDDSITLEDVTFSYDNKNIVLENINLKIRKRKKYVILGESGCGKSTLAKLVSGYYSNFSGTIHFDEKDISNYSVQSSPSLISNIHQNIYMFDTSIKNNITLYDTYHNDELDNVLETSGVKKFIGGLSDGIDSLVGENGNKLSGGQRQRIAIARALIKNTPILILDEGTSAIDKKTAKEIEEQLLHVSNLTLLTITHNLDQELLQNYDEIIFMENGKIAEVGTFQQLINSKSKFSNFFAISTLQHNRRRV